MKLSASFKMFMTTLKEVQGDFTKKNERKEMNKIIRSCNKKVLIVFQSTHDVGGLESGHDEES